MDKDVKTIVIITIKVICGHIWYIAGIPNVLYHDLQ